MGSGASKDKNAEKNAPFESVEAALAAGKSQDEVDKYMSENCEDGLRGGDDAAAEAADGVRLPVENGIQAATEAAPATAAADSTSLDGIDRSEIERNKNGCEEPSSVDPELWNIDNCEVDILVKYKMGGQMWYVQSRMRENTAKNPPKPIPGFPMNQKAVDAKRYYSKDDEEFNQDSTNFASGAEWKKIEAANPPAVA